MEAVMLDTEKTQAQLIDELEVLRGRVRELERLTDPQERDRVLHDMGERIKELRCVYGVARSIHDRKNLDEIFQDVTALIPPGWHYPEITRGRVCFGGVKYDSCPFEETPWKLASDIVIGGERRGAVEVYYTQERPELDEGPFLAEERNLIDGIALALSEAVERKEAEEALQVREHELGERVKELSCLYGIAELVERPGATLERILQGTVDLIPPSWQHASIAGARITVEGRVYRTANFCETIWKQASDVVVGGNKAGCVELCYLEERPESDEGPFLEEEQRLIGAIAQRVGRVVERIRGEEERAALQEQLHQAQKMEAVGQLAGGITHDVNNFATAILGYVALARAALEEDHKAIELLDGLEDAAEQAASLTRALLTFSQKLVTKKEAVDLREQVNRALKLLRRVMPASIEVVADSLDGPPIWVHADEAQVQQVVMNLAINARDSMPDGGTLRVSVSKAIGDQDETRQEKEGNHLVARLVVADSGIGMTPEVQTRIFEPFFTTKPRGQGTGLGMAITHGIVKEHGGHIGFHTEPGQGTTFTVEFPLIEGEFASAIVRTPTITARGQGEVVLLAEDNRHVQRIITSALQSLNYEVIQAHDGASLMERFAEQRSRIQLLVIDLDLPKRSGDDCLREIRATGVNVPAIIITGGSGADLEEKLDEDSTLLRKPFQITEFSALAGRLLAARRPQEAPA